MRPSPRGDLGLGSGGVHSGQSFNGFERVSRFSETFPKTAVGVSGPHLSRRGVFTQDGFVVYGEDRSVVVYVQHGDDGDAFSNLGRVL